jgi:hypothetical protein
MLLALPRAIFYGNGLVSAPMYAISPRNQDVMLSLRQSVEVALAISSKNGVSCFGVMP